ncbi:26037_t:CDS:2 [Gigaspora margarita]|uniref:26037_t:CDS:1 n=1 Tax=Gigaspora margarita TaxID=4874 RepID=A0ABM8VVQ3_GIGMA|nr:26037_t:CDS:2 [Gigaspora margarita]
MPKASSYLTQRVRYLLLKTFTENVKSFQTRSTLMLNNYPNIKAQSESYLAQREKYKKITFSNDEDSTNEELLEINKLFYKTIKKLNEEEIPKFIIITSYQDIIAFYYSMINVVQKDQYFKFKGKNEYNFISDQKNIFQDKFESVCKNLPKNVIEKYKNILSALDNEKLGVFINASKYQDIIYICDRHLAQLNNEYTPDI